jgi:hypothetical protein
MRRGLAGPPAPAAPRNAAGDGHVLGRRACGPQRAGNPLHGFSRRSLDWSSD